MIFDLFLVNFMVALVILVLAPQGYFFFYFCNRLQLIMQLNVIFKSFFSKLHLWLLAVADKVAYATTVFLQFFLKDGIFAICYKEMIVFLQKSF